MLTDVIRSGAKPLHECSCKAQALPQGLYRNPFGSDGQCRALRRLFRSLCLAAALPYLALGFPVPALEHALCFAVAANVPGQTPLPNVAAILPSQTPNPSLPTSSNNAALGEHIMPCLPLNLQVHTDIVHCKRHTAHASKQSHSMTDLSGELTCPPLRVMLSEEWHSLHKPGVCNAFSMLLCDACVKLTKDARITLQSSQTS